MSDRNLTPQFMLHVEQGVEFEHTFQWLDGGLFMAPIEDVEVGYPTVMRVTGHGLNSVSPHPIIISGCDGLDFINTDDVGIPLCTRIDADTFSVPMTTQGEEWVVGTGEITYHIPTVLTGFTGRCVIRKNWYAEDFYHEMTTENGGMTLVVADGSIQLLMTKAETAAFAWKHAFYDVDLISPGVGNPEFRVFRGPVINHRQM